MFKVSTENFSFLLQLNGKLRPCIKPCTYITLHSDGQTSKRRNNEQNTLCTEHIMHKETNKETYCAYRGRGRRQLQARQHRYSINRARFKIQKKNSICQRKARRPTCLSGEHH